MSYENAVPKPLKFLISDGKMLDDQGNVIAESETLKDLYTKWEPEVKKYLLSDGSVVDEEGNLIIKNEYYKKMYDQADPKVAKYLHADGTVDENSGQTVNLQDNKQVNITTSSDVEIEPDSGYVGMKKVTATMHLKIYAWNVIHNGNDEGCVYLAFEKSPESKSSTVSVGCKCLYAVISEGGILNKVSVVNVSGKELIKQSDTEFVIRTKVGNIVASSYTFTREDVSKDVVLW